MSQAHPAPSQEKSISPEQFDQIALLFKTLGEPMRLRILRCVCQTPKYVGEIVEATGSTQPNISKHLSVLVSTGILARRKDGQRVHYSLKNPLVMRLCETVSGSLPQA
jgi:ArsR family transcriptional regulator